MRPKQERDSLLYCCFLYGDMSSQHIHFKSLILLASTFVSLRIQPLEVRTRHLHYHQHYLGFDFILHCLINFKFNVHPKASLNNCMLITGIIDFFEIIMCWCKTN